MKKSWVLLLLLCSASLFIANVVSSATTELRFGINYQSTNHHYESARLTDDVLDRDFSLFQDQGLEFIILNVIWKSFENDSIGAYNEAGIGNLTRICEFAEKYNLKVIIDFHTYVKKDSVWSIPEWVDPRCFETVFTDGTIRDAWLNFVGYIVDRLQDVDNIESWQMMNEPAIGSWACAVSVDDYVNLWTEMKNRIRLFSDKPVSIRFSAETFWHFDYDPRIYDICDYFSINWYIQSGPLFEGNFTAAVLDAQEHGCAVMVSEFGVDVDPEDKPDVLVDDAGVTELYLDSLYLFGLLEIDDCAAWFWRADFDSEVPEPPGTDCNLAIDVNGTPREAFYLLDNELAPTPSPTPTPTPTASPSPSLTPTPEPTATPPPSSPVVLEFLVIILIGVLTGFALTFIFLKRKSK